MSLLALEATNFSSVLSCSAADSMRIVAVDSLDAADNNITPFFTFQTPLTERRGGSVFRHSVTVHKLDSIFRDCDGDYDKRMLLKVDTEGSDFEVLSGAQNILTNASSIFVMFECSRCST